MESLGYRLIRSDRKTLALEIKDGELLVRAPLRCPKQKIDMFVGEHAAWAKKALEKTAATKANADKLTAAEIQALGEQALAYIPGRVKYYAPLVGVSVNGITIRCQKTKWGSCSAKGNLNFNCLLMLMPKEVIDSVVVHELCHRKHMDHSPAFYAEIDRVFPDYKKQNGWLKAHGAEIMAKVF